MTETYNIDYLLVDVKWRLRDEPIYEPTDYENEDDCLLPGCTIYSEHESYNIAFSYINYENNANSGIYQHLCRIYVDGKLIHSLYVNLYTDTNDIHFTDKNIEALAKLGYILFYNPPDSMHY